MHLFAKSMHGTISEVLSGGVPMPSRDDPLILRGDAAMEMARDLCRLSERLSREIAAMYADAAASYRRLIVQLAELRSKVESS
jgi:hypothetical protein